MAEGYVTKLALEQGEIIGYEFVHLGKLMQYVTDGMDGNEALKKATGRYGRFDEAEEYIVPRKQ